jgi:hypothetical protein
MASELGDRDDSGEGGPPTEAPPVSSRDAARETEHPRTRPAISRRLVIIVVAVLAAIVVIAVLALSQLAGREDVVAVKDSTWPAAFAGTWVSTADASKKLVVSRTPGRAVLATTGDFGQKIIFYFQDDTLAWDEGTGEALKFFRRTPGSVGDFIGDYEWDTGVEPLRLTVRYDGKTLTVVTRSMLAADPLTTTYTLADDGETLVSKRSDSDSTVTWKRQ